MTVARVRDIVIAVVILALAAGGCGGDDNDASTGTPQADTHFTKDELKRFSIKRADLPADYKKTRSTSGTGDDCLPSQTGDEATVNSRLRALGLQACTGTTYRNEVRDGDGTFRNEVFSGGFGFPDADSASEALPLIRRALIASARATGDARIISRHSMKVSGLGDETARGATIRLGLLDERFAFYLYFWRAGNVVATMGSSDFVGGQDEQAALEIARRIDHRATRDHPGS